MLAGALVRAELIKPVLGRDHRVATFDAEGERLAVHLAALLELPAQAMVVIDPVFKERCGHRQMFALPISKRRAAIASGMSAQTRHGISPWRAPLSACAAG